MRTPWFIEGMLGLGDNFYQRAIVRELVKRETVYLATPWPQLYADLPVRCTRPNTTLRTQAKNAARPWAWHALPDYVDHRSWSYAGRPGSMLQALCDDVGLNAPTVDFTGPPVRSAERAPYIVVRPVTRRTEWKSASREPDPQYVARAAAALRRQFRIVSVADLAPPHEIAIGALPAADETIHHGELAVEDLLGLVAGAAGVIGGVGWAVPAAIAYRVPMLLVYGGSGFHNGPERIFDPRMDTSRMVQAVPDRFCTCARADHDCAKQITALDRSIESFAKVIAC